MVKLSRLFGRLNRVRICVIGDLMYDTYTTGKVERISPEAPVSVLHVIKEEGRPGGAGNVVLNLISLGAQVVAIGRTGRDKVGEELIQALSTEGVDVRGIITEPAYQTPVKNRLIADAQQILRVDFERRTPLSEGVEHHIVKQLPLLLEGVDMIALSDYGKGFLSRPLLGAVMETAQALAIPVIVDPKGDDFTKYHGATLLKPNLSEAYEAAKLPRRASLEEVADVLFKTVRMGGLMITRSEAGISLFSKEGERRDFPVQSKEVKDVTGAGDTVLAMTSFALANRLEITEALRLANIAAGLAIERIGCARIPLSEVAHRLLEIDVENKIFEEDHLFALQQALQGKQYTILGIHATHGMTTPLFRSIRSLAQRTPDSKLIIYVRDLHPDEEFITLLSSLAEVDFVVLQGESLKNVCELLHPSEVFIMEEQSLVPVSHFTALLSS